MSRITAPLYHTTLPFTFPREPIISNKTPAERGHQSTTTVTLTSAMDRHISEDTLQPTHSETPLHSGSRGPSVSYQNSGFRDSSTRPVHRNYRHFVVVIPPSRLIQEHGQLGHTLSSGPPHRLSQGIIMPLFPTMYGQLNAIAKEFNFPSTTGLCLYLQLNEDGVVMAPRISDESWHMLWNNLFDMPSVGHGPPIGGRIEFDIDFGQARWYPSWLSTASQDSPERSISRVSSLATSLFHTRRDSINEDGFRSHDNTNFHLSHPRGNTNVRHVPRKLSLVDRFDVSGGGQGLPDPGQPKALSKALSPIAQVDEPKSARHQLDDRVRSWRASAIVATTSLASSQTDLDPTNLPNHMTLHNDPPTNFESELNLEDFTWSISSLGPGEYEVMSVDNYPNCLPSPDIAKRMLDDSPLTPLTATTWGAPSYYPASPLSHFECSSLDLGFRNTFSRPVTPTTMTSWGPASPAVSAFDWYHEVPRPRSVHLGERGVFSRPVTPTTATSWGAPLSYPPTPFTAYHVNTPDAAQRFFDYAEEIGSLLSPSGPIEKTWKFVWPYFKAADASTIEAKQGAGYPNFSIYSPIYPNFDLYPSAAASANLQIDTTRSQAGTIFVTASQYPQFDIYPTASHSSNLYSTFECSQLVEGRSITSYGAYPNLVIYPGVYPHFNLYPGKAAEVVRNSQGSKLEIFVNLPSFYPNINIYLPTYPNFELYPSLVASKGDTGKNTTSSSDLVVPPSLAQSEIITQACHYPIVCPYAPVYPHFELYPSVTGVQNDKPLVKQSISLPGGTGYPLFNLYPPLTGSIGVVSSPHHHYPSLEIYPPLPQVHSLVMVPQPTQVLPQDLTKVAATTATQVCATRGRKSHWELREEVLGRDPVRDIDDANAVARRQSICRPQSIKYLRDSRRIAMTRSPTGPAFRRPIMPPALPSLTHQVPPTSTLCANGDSRPSHVFDEMTVHQMTIPSARRRSPTISSPSRVAMAATQKTSMVLPKLADSNTRHGSVVDIDVPRMGLTSLSRSSLTGSGTKLMHGPR